MDTLGVVGIIAGIIVGLGTLIYIWFQIWMSFLNQEEFERSKAVEAEQQKYEAETKWLH